jgi:hypothetical protein
MRRTRILGSSASILHRVRASFVVAAAAVAVLAFFGGGWAGGALTGHEVNTNVSSDGMFQTEPFIAVQPNDPSRVVAATNPIGFASMPAWISDDHMKEGTAVRRLMPEMVVLPASETGTDGVTLASDVIADPSVVADREGTFWYGAVTRFSATQRDCVPGGDPRMCHVVINRIAAGTTEFRPTTTAIPAADPMTAAFQDKSQLGIDDWPGSPRRGSLYAVWSPLPVSGSGAFSRVVISQCSTRLGGVYDPAHCDDPDNWSQPVDVADSDSASNPFFASVTAAPNGEVYVAWVDEIGGAIEIDRCSPAEDCATAAAWAGGDAVVATLSFPPQDPSDPGGFKKLACPIPAEPEVSPPSSAPFAEAGPDGRVYIVFGDLRDNGTTKCTGSSSDDTFDSFVAVLAPTALAFPNVQARVSLSGDAPAANDHFLASLAVNPMTGEVESHFYSTTGDATRGTVDVYYVRSVDGGFTYSPMQRISRASSDFRATNAFFDHYLGADSGADPGATAGSFYPAWIDNRADNGPGFREQELYVLTLEADPPETTIDSGPSGLTNDATPTFTFSADEPAATFECSLDTGTAAFSACSGPGASHTPAGPLSDGAYTFRVRATDQAGNTDPTPATRALELHACTITGTGDSDTLNGTGGVDVICGFAGDDVVNPLAGNDIVFVGAGDDRVTASLGDDRLLGEEGHDSLDGGQGDDRLDGGPGTDSCKGGLGVDTAGACESTRGVP